MPNVKLTKEIIKLCYYANVPSYLWGATASAKTALVKQVAKQMEIPCISLFFQTQEPGDILGLPHVEIMTPEGTDHKVKVTSWASPEWFAYIAANPRRGIIFGDEANRAQSDTAQTFTCLVTERKFHIHKVPHGWKFIFASNYGSEYDIRELDVAIMARFCHIKVSPEVNEWLEWGKTEDATDFGPLHKKVSSFIKSSPTHLVQGEAAESKGWEPKPNRRTWEWVSNVMYAYGTHKNKLDPKLRESALRLAISGLVGKGVPSALLTDKYIDVMAILKDPTKFDLKDVNRFSREVVPVLAKVNCTAKMYGNLKNILLVQCKEKKDLSFNIARNILRSEDTERWANKMREDDDIKEFYATIREEALGPQT